MPKWIHDRAEHLLAKNPSMTKSQAFAIATQQSHKLGKSPKGYGTKEGKREARVKYDKPRKEYTKGANPGDLESPKLAAMADELEKEAVNLAALKNMSYMGKRLAGGAALGAAGGAAAGAAAGGEGGRLKGALKGALGGAALGGAAGYAAPRMAAHMKGGASLGQAAKNVGSEGSQQLREGAKTLGERALRPVKRLKSRRAVTQAEKLKGKNLDSLAGAETAEALKEVSPETLKQIKSSITPEMAARGMNPEAAFTLLSRGARGGEDAATAIARQVREAAGAGVAGTPIVRSGPEAVTNIARRAVKPAPRGRTMMMTSPPPGALKVASVLEPQVLEQMKEHLGDALEGEQTMPQKQISSVRKLIDHFRKKAEATPYLLDQIGEPKVRPLPAEAPNPKHRVKQAMIPGAGQFAKTLKQGAGEAAKKLKQHQSVGVPKMKAPTVKPLSIKVGFAESQYSGGTGPGPFTNYASRIPPFVVPPLNQKTSGPPGEVDDKKKSKTAAMADELAKLNAVTSPQSQLGKAQRVGATRATAPPGPSIQQIAKPVGYGRAQPGTTKTGV